MAERKMTGNAVAYFKALQSERNFGLRGVLATVLLAAEASKGGEVPVRA